MELSADPDIESLADRARLGDTDALETLLAAIQPRVKRICGRILLHPEDVEDAVEVVVLVDDGQNVAVVGLPAVGLLWACRFLGLV